jgi:proteasome lid subunit RPN8/RPN11
MPGLPVAGHLSARFVVPDAAFVGQLVAKKGGPFRLSRNERRRLHRRAYQCQQDNHGEVCGILVKRPGRRLAFVFVENKSDRPGHFEMKGSDIARLRRKLQVDGKTAIGYFHSHPISPAIPSRRDVETTPRGSFHLIYDVCGLEAKLWYFVKRSKETLAIDFPLRQD